MRHLIDVDGTEKLMLPVLPQVMTVSRDAMQRVSAIRRNHRYHTVTNGGVISSMMDPIKPRAERHTPPRVARGETAVMKVSSAVSEASAPVSEERIMS